MQPIMKMTIISRERRHALPSPANNTINKVNAWIGQHRRHKAGRKIALSNPQQTMACDNRTQAIAAHIAEEIPSGNNIKNQEQHTNKHQQALSGAAILKK